MSCRSLDGSQNLKSGHDAKGTVKAAAVWNRIKMRAKQDRRGILCTAGEEGRVIAGAINAEFQARFLNSLAEPEACGKMGLTERRSVDTPVARRANFGESIERQAHPVRVDAKRAVPVRHGLLALTLGRMDDQECALDLSKVLAHLGHDLPIRHFIGRFDAYVPAEALFDGEPLS